MAHRKSSSSETNQLRNIEHSLRPTTTQLTSSEYSSKKKLIYPNVPKRSQPQDDAIATESEISIISSGIKHNKKRTIYPSVASSSNQNAYTRHTLDLITKYTSPQKRIPIDSSNDNYITQSQPTYQQNNKRPQSFDDDDDTDELSQLLDHRYCKKSLSQFSMQDESRKPTMRKPTARKLSTNQQKPVTTKKLTDEPSEMLIIEPDIDTEEDDKNNRQISTLEPKTFNLITLCQNDLLNSTCSSSNPASKHALNESALNFSPISKVRIRPDSAGSSSSFLFETPCSTLSHATITKKTNQETETLSLSTTDIIHQLILNMNENQTKIDYNPIEISKNLFHKSKYPTVRSLIKKQFLNIGRYEIEILFPNQSHEDFLPKSSTVYVCDICLKHFPGSSVAFQRHTSKCLSTQPPGKLIFNEKDLSIFQIGSTTKFTMEQRIYLKSLCRIARLFLDSKRSIDDTKIDQFTYYILCRKDPILAPFQSPIYRFMGYFSKQINQYAQHCMNNLSCLFMLPPFAQHQEYNQLLIAFSYFLIRSNASENLTYSSPARPLDSLSLSMLRIYWCDKVLAYIKNNQSSSIKTITLDGLARETFIHPKDILLSLYYCGFIVLHPTDKSCVYMRLNSNVSMTKFNPQMKNDLLFSNLKSMDTLIDNNNNDKNHDSGIEEIILD